ncbi:hypothetical protein LVO39_004164 [Salmonella enterica]|uniref:hypothetical protein n=1 Tax=Salmonella enterica TaxID=28901 RepID=UPI0013931EE1|nr:hypothetical protein [Salmonella enterica]EDO3332292.1 hypothetical protein [Salmonella enterica subsp. enterica serovar Infantis]EHF2472830.1 hypothetical protein [Salmonella enterica subsp. enterica serovar Pensacola]EJI0209266.1 hypothetical protein [Salmonella enterica subsp. enterica]EEA0763764.1 hypothetical protein [Salmonella enterica]EEA8857278.1 hypothetical protein [Salmonella enterica]
MIFVLFLLLVLVLYCPCYMLQSVIGRQKGFSVFTLRHRGRSWRVVYLTARERAGRMSRYRVKFYHHAFQRALNEALQTGGGSLPLTPDASRGGQTLMPTRRRHHIVMVNIPLYEHRLMALLMLLQEWRFIRLWRICRDRWWRTRMRYCCRRRCCLAWC